MTSKVPLKSILKSSPTVPPHISDPQLSKAERDRQTALYHANLIQQRKDIELEILRSTETLLDLPTDPISDPSKPSPADSLLFRKLLVPFQPSDYDCLIQERNICDKCGYVLCPRRPQKQDTKAKYRILYGQGKEGFKVVDRESLERWCSADCARRGLYIRVQLGEEPAWVRQGEGREMILWDERHNVIEDVDSDNTSALKYVVDLKDPDLEGEEMAWKMHELALERGDSAESRRQHLVQIDIKENEAAGSGNVSAPSLPDASSGGPEQSHTAIEGHKPGGVIGRQVRNTLTSATAEGDQDTDWAL